MDQPPVPGFAEVDELPLYSVGKLELQSRILWHMEEWRVLAHIYDIDGDIKMTEIGNGPYYTNRDTISPDSLVGLISLPEPRQVGF